MNGGENNTKNTKNTKNNGDAPLEVWGSEGSFNLESVLSTNVRTSDYFRKTGKLELVTEVIDEIYYRVEHVEPWMTGGARGPSTAFCLLVRLFTIRLSERDVRSMMDHVDSPYIRCIGFLYARYVVQPRTMWALLKNYVHDEEEFTPSADGKRTMTMGRYVRDLLLNRRYFDTLLPRIPTLLEKEIVAAMEEEIGTSAMRAVSGDADGAAGSRSRPVSVKESLSMSTRQRVPNRSVSREDDERDRERGAYRGRGGREQDRGYERDRDRSRSRDRERYGYGDKYGGGSHNRYDRYGNNNRDNRYDNRDRRYDNRERYDNRDRCESRDRHDHRDDRRDRYGGGATGGKWR